MPCRLCLQDRKLVKSHVIPEAFWRVMRDEVEGAPWLVSGADGVHAQRSHIGVYDQGILCDECEPKFGDLDDYGIRVLLKDFDREFKPIFLDTMFPPRIAGYESTTVDQDRLLRFLVSVLWRASVSTQPFYQHVSLGDLEVAAATVIVPTTAVPATFGAVLARWSPAEDMGYEAHGMLDPIRITPEGTPAHIIYFGECVAYVRATEVPFGPKLGVNRLGADANLRVVLRDFGRSNELQAMMTTATRSRERQVRADEVRSLRRKALGPEA
jgi:hypothetical protein